MRSRGRCSGNGRRAAGLRRLESLDFDIFARRRSCCHLRLGFGFRSILFHVGERKLELFEDRAALGRLAVLLMAQLGDGELHLLDQQRAGARFRFRVQARPRGRQSPSP